MPPIIAIENGAHLDRKDYMQSLKNARWMEKCKIWVLPKSKVLYFGSRWKKLNQFGGVFNEGVQGMRRHDDLWK